MQPEIINFYPLRIAGKALKMSFAEDRTFELWNSFMKRLKEFNRDSRPDLFSLKFFEPSFDIKELDTGTIFEKWAATGINENEIIPEGMVSCRIEGGLYAKFEYKGEPSKGQVFFRYIYSEWLPSSNYFCDNTRPHFEILGEKYKGEHPDSEEYVFIPVKLRN